MNRLASSATRLVRRRLVRITLLAAAPLLWMGTPQLASADAHNQASSTIQVTGYAVLCGCTNLFVPVDYMCPTGLPANDVVVLAEQGGLTNQGQLTVKPNGSPPPPFACDGKKHSQYIEVLPSNYAFETGSANVTVYIANCDAGVCSTVSGGASISLSVPVKAR